MNKGILWIKLDKESKENLIRLVKPKFPNVFCDHTTLLYGVSSEGFEEIIGKKQEIIALENCWNDLIQAVTVQFTQYLPNKNINPHITISTINGVSPVKSNKMLVTDYNNEIIYPILKLSSVVEFCEFNSR